MSNLIFDHQIQKTRYSKLAPAYEPLYKLGAELLFESSYRRKQDSTETLLYGQYTHNIESFLSFSNSLTQANIFDSYNSSKAHHRLECCENELNLSPKKFDLALSNLSLHFINDIPALLKRYSIALREHGLFSATLLGDYSFSELKEAFAYADQQIYGGTYLRIMPLISSTTAPSLMLHAGFRDVVIYTERLKLKYQSIIEMLHSLQIMGFSNFLTTSQANPLSRQMLKVAENYYFYQHSTDDKIHITFDIIVFSGFK